MGKIIFRLPGEPEFVLDSEKMLRTAEFFEQMAADIQFFEQMAADIQKEIVTRETHEQCASEGRAQK